MSEQNGTAAVRQQLVDEVIDARHDIIDANEHLMDEDNDGSFYGDINKAEARHTAAETALANFDAANPQIASQVQAAKIETDEQKQLDFLRRLRADEGLSLSDERRLAALQAKYGKHYLDMTPEEQAIQRAKNADEMQARDDAFWAEWTAEATAARKIAWNSGLEAAGIRREKTKVPAGFSQYDFEAKMGFSLANLKRATARYK